MPPALLEVTHPVSGETAEVLQVVQVGTKVLQAVQVGTCVVAVDAKESRRQTRLWQHGDSGSSASGGGSNGGSEAAALMAVARFRARAQQRTGPRYILVGRWLNL